MMPNAWDCRINSRLGKALMSAAGLLLRAIVLLAAAANSPARTAEPLRFILHDVPRTLPVLSFEDGSGRQRTLEEFRGKVVLLNVWATWCGPCRREMPTLDRLQARLGGPQFQVIALSVDRGGPNAVHRFYAETGVRHLALFIDSAALAGLKLGLFGLPGTLLIDREGRERGRLIGPAEWDSPEMIAFLKSEISKAGTRRADESPSVVQTKESVQ